MKRAADILGNSFDDCFFPDEPAMDGGQAAIACERRCGTMAGGLNEGLRCWL